jgi:hypothetical protein
MKAVLVISLYRYLYLKLAKMLCFSYYRLCFLFNKIGRTRGGGGLVQTMYIHVSKCKNDKIKNTTEEILYGDIN